MYRLHLPNFLVQRPHQTLERNNEPSINLCFQSLYPDINPAHSPPYNLGTHLHGTCRRNIFLWSHLWRSHHCRSRTWTGSFHDHRVFTKTSRKIRTEAKNRFPNEPWAETHHNANATTVANNISCSRRVDSFRHHCLVSSRRTPAMESPSHCFTQTTVHR